MTELRTIVVLGRRRRVTLVAETTVDHGKQEGALRREYVDDDGALHVRFDQEDLVGPELSALRARQAQDSHAVELARQLPTAARRRVLNIPSGTVTRALGVAWARHGSVYLVGDGGFPVPRALVQSEKSATPPPPTPRPRPLVGLTHIPKDGFEEWSRADDEARAAFGAQGRS